MGISMVSTLCFAYLSVIILPFDSLLALPFFYTSVLLS